jgi:DNA-binding CsgD family transcriptional regulator/signal transduction histidine kinase
MRSVLQHPGMAELAPRPIHATAARLPGERDLAHDAISLPAISELLAAPVDEVAERARAALDPVLSHDALVLVTPASPRFPVLIAASRGARERLARVDWEALVGEPHESDTGSGDDPVRLMLPDVVGGLRLIGWLTGAAGPRVALLIGSQRPFALEPFQERAAAEVATLAAAREREIAEDPSPGTLAFSHAISQERERVRWELQSNHTVTLTAMLRLLRQEGGRTRDPAIAQAIDVASRALLESRAAAKREETALHVSLKSEFSEAQTEVHTIAHPSGLRPIFGLEGADEMQVPWAIAQAARAATRAAALLATNDAGGDKLRVHWKLADDTLTITVCDNGTAVVQPGTDPVPELALMRRRVAALNGTVELDAVPEWGTALTCRLPLHDVAPAPESPATQRISELRAREREVLELMVTGLRNREIADRLFITVRTVKFHVSNILRKLEVQSRTEAIAVAHSAGISALTSPHAEAPAADQI